MQRLRLAPPIALALLLGTIGPAAVVSAAAAPSWWAADCALNIRARPTTAAAKTAVIPRDTVVTVTAKVSGGHYATPCSGYVSGASWYAITAINGRGVRSLFGVDVVYSASRLFRPATSSHLEGIDVSRWQGTIDYSRVWSAGFRFVIAKATEGRLYADDAYARNRAAAQAAGLAFTAYHHAHPDPTPNDATLEADNFIAVAGMTPGMLPPVLDIESGSSLGTPRLQQWVETWLSRVYTRLGVHAMIYTNPAFWRTAMGDTRWFSQHGYDVLWIAHWDATAPDVPAGEWDGRGWTFWQRSNCGAVPGISGCVDLDQFRGFDLSALGS
jgi:lysozyme